MEIKKLSHNIIRDFTCADLTEVEVEKGDGLLVFCVGVPYKVSKSAIAYLKEKQAFNGCVVKNVPSINKGGMIMGNGIGEFLIISMPVLLPRKNDSELAFQKMYQRYKRILEELDDFEQKLHEAKKTKNLISFLQ